MFHLNVELQGKVDKLFRALEGIYFNYTKDLEI
jgi:hypothetical protein